MTSFLFLTFVSCHVGILSFFLCFLPLLPLHAVFFCLRHRINLCTKIVCGVVNYIPFARDVIFVIPVRHTFLSYSHRFVGIDNFSIFGLVFPNIAASFEAPFCWCFTWRIGLSNFLQTFFMVCLNSSSFGSMMKIPRNCLALSSFWFLDSPCLLCFSLHQTYASTYLAIHWRVLRLFASLVSLLPDHEYPSGGLSFNINKSCEACPCIRYFFLHPRPSNHQYVFPTIHPVMYVLFW